MIKIRSCPYQNIDDKCHTKSFHWESKSNKKNLPALMFSVDDRTITKVRLKKLKYGGLGLTPQYC